MSAYQHVSETSISARKPLCGWPDGWPIPKQQNSQQQNTLTTKELISYCASRVTSDEAWISGQLASLVSSTVDLNQQADDVTCFFGDGPVIPGVLGDGAGC